MIKKSKLAKKRFTDGLDNLFGGTEEQSEQTLSLFPKSKSKKREKKSNKGFASQLDAFLAEALEEHEEKKNTPASGTKRKRLTGLDLLIQQTKDAPTHRSTRISDKRRLTLAFDKKQLESLKNIAESEGVYLKDLINQLIERFLQEKKE